MPKKNSENPDIFYVRMVMQPWNSAFHYEGGLFGGATVPFTGVKSCGFLEVFDSMEDFKAIYPDETPVMIMKLEKPVD